MGLNSRYIIPPPPWILDKTCFELGIGKKGSKNRTQKVQNLDPNNSSVIKVISKKSNIEGVQSPNHSPGGSSSQEVKEVIPEPKDNSNSIESKNQISPKIEPTSLNDNFEKELERLLEDDPEKIPKLIYEEVINNGVWGTEAYLSLLRYLSEELKNHGGREEILFRVKSRYDNAMKEIRVSNE